MIERHSRPELAALWSDASRFEPALRRHPAPLEPTGADLDAAALGAAFDLDHHLWRVDRFLDPALAEGADV